MSSRRIRAMAKLINDIEAEANALPCTDGSPCRCSILMLIAEYRNEFQAPEAAGLPEPSQAEGSKS